MLKIKYLLVLLILPIAFLLKQQFDHRGPKPTPPLILYPTDDALVSNQSGDREKNFGQSQVLATDAAPVAIESFLKFRVPKLPNRPKAAFLYLTVANNPGAESTASGTLRNLKNNHWTEKTITWANKPVVDGHYSWVIHPNGAVLGKTYTIDISNYLDKLALGGEFSFVITTSSADGTSYNSKEADFGRPKLVLYFTTPPPNFLIFPFIKKLSSQEATIVWGFEKRYPVKLFYGQKKNNLWRKAKITTRSFPTTTTHSNQPLFLYQAKLNHLKPNTTYFYNLTVHSQNLLLKGPLRFKTPPQKDQPLPVTAAIIGDFGLSNPPEVADIYQIWKAQPDILLTTGDNALPHGSFSAWENTVFGYLNERLTSQIPFYPVPGDHDLMFSFRRQIGHGWLSPYEIFFGDRSRPGELYRSVDYGLLHIVLLDSNWMENSRMLAWFKNDLEKNYQPNQWLLVFWHHPFYSCAPNDLFSRGRSVAARPYIQALAANGGGILFWGHQHLYCRNKKIIVKNNADVLIHKDDIVVPAIQGNQGVRFNFHRGDIISFISGGGGNILNHLGKTLPWSTDKVTNKFHFLILQSWATKMEILARTPDGQILDRVTIFRNDAY